jgi:TRAP-type transport system large permease protein
MVLNLLIGLVTPPVGMVLFVLSGVSGVSIEKISKATIPYILVSAGVILLIIVYTYLMAVHPGLPVPY